MSRLLTTAEAAKALGIHARTIQRWTSEGLVVPEFTTLGGHARWDLEKLKAQIREMRRHYE